MINKRILFVPLLAGLVVPGDMSAMLPRPALAAVGGAGDGDVRVADDDDYGSDSEMRAAMKELVRLTATFESRRMSRHRHRRMLEFAVALKDAMNSGVAVKECNQVSFSEAGLRAIFVPKDAVELAAAVDFFREKEHNHILVVESSSLYSLPYYFKSLGKKWSIVVLGDLPDDCTLGASTMPRYSRIVTNCSQLIFASPLKIVFCPTFPADDTSNRYPCENYVSIDDCCAKIAARLNRASRK